MRIYCCGVFDLAHYGYFEFLERVAGYGDVVVGVHNDNTCTDYKRKPYLKCEDRCRTLKHIKHVSEIIPNAPLVTTLEFLDEHNIDIVAIPEEYSDGRGDYYKEIIDAGRFVVIPRTEGISTTDIVKLIERRLK